MKALNILIGIAAVAIGCKEAKKSETNLIKKADWLIGSWEQTTDHGKMTETWTRVDDSTFTGESYLIKEKDTLNSEQLILSQRGGRLTYTPTVQNQNGGKPVDFVLTSGMKNQLIFENPKHDFPQRISYTKITNDSMVAGISGKEYGKYASENYPMKRR